MKFIAYYRVSTREQGISGLGLEAQQGAVRKYAESIQGELLQEYIEIESGTKRERGILQQAIQHAHKENAVLVVKRLDRLSRGGLQIILDMEAKGVKFLESDSPHDNDLIRDIKLSLARDEARNVSERTKSALAVIKEKIKTGTPHTSKAGNIVKSLGNPHNLTRKAVDKSVEVRTKAAKENPDNVKAGAMIALLISSGANFAQATKALNNAGFKTSKGNDFSQVQTKRLYERYSND